MYMDKSKININLDNVKVKYQYDHIFNMIIYTLKGLFHTHWPAEFRLI